MYTPSTSRATTVAGTPSSETQSGRNTTASSRIPNQRQNRTPTRLTEEGFSTVMNSMELQRHASYRSLPPQTPANPNMQLAAYYEELGRLRAQIEHDNALIRELQYEKRMLDNANHSMHQQNSRDQMALREADKERSRLMSEIARLQEEKDLHQVALKQLQDQVAKQQKTIKVQSDQISNPSANKARTPQHAAPIGGFNQIYGQRPPGYNGPQSGPSSAFPPSTPAFAPPMSRDPSAASSLGAPMSRQQSAPAFQTMVRPSAMPDNKLITNGPAYSIGNNQQLARVKGTEPMNANLLPEYAPFFNMVEKWARGYCNVPDKEKDSSLPSSLLQNLKQHTNASALPKLMSSGGTRYLAVAKVMNQTIVNVAFRPVVLRGFTNHHDRRIADTRAQLHQVGMPLHVRRACLVACAQTVLEMTTTQGFRAFIEKLVARQVDEMWSNLGPLFAPGIARNEAWDDLRQIWREACRIGVLMMCKASMFTCEFPPVGSDSLFNPSNMVCRDHLQSRGPLALNQIKGSIRLAITPIVTETDFMGTGVANARTLYFSNVLLDS